MFVSVPHGGAAGNILRTGLMKRLLDAQPDCEIVLLSPLANDEAFVREFQHARVRVVDLPPHRPEGREARLMALIQASYIDSRVTESVAIRRQEAIANKTIRWIRAKRLLASAFAPSIVRKPTRYELIDRLVSHPWAEALFDRHRPALLVTSSPGLIFSEIPLLRTAVRRRIRAVAVDPSWDNFTNKLLPVRRVDRLIVWNALMRQQAVDLHGYDPDEIRIAGAPQWDLYFHDATFVPRDAFFRRIGANPARKLITLTTTPRALYAHHDHVLRVLIDALASRAWRHDAQLLVRLHPRDDLPRQYDAPQRRRRERRVDARGRSGDCRHPGCERRLRRRDADGMDAIGAQVLSLHSLRERDASRRGARRRDTRAARRSDRTVSRRPVARSRRTAPGRAGAVRVPRRPRRRARRRLRRRRAERNLRDAGRNARRRRAMKAMKIGKDVVRFRIIRMRNGCLAVQWTRARSEPHRGAAPRQRTARRPSNTRRQHRYFQRVSTYATAGLRSREVAGAAC
ncbi:MAG: hypothetical protein DMF99_16315 [Acidobacteria bacterium]|nr:MAG: hypothetical protein DMF99_16315 [Acidobacteriota bacterium]